ncbi:MAG: helicase SNF2 [Actinomycetota bacterium]|nr:MAG: helicase SNF2 [Actinomycetota bacterium]
MQRVSRRNLCGWLLSHCHKARGKVASHFVAFQTKFGRTWWGAKWLNALSQIDYDNRLPRGRSYANRGAVTDLEIHENDVNASVEGSRPRPYKVEISVPRMTEHQVAALLDELVKDPVIISKMLNRELDPKVLVRSSELKIPIFPTKWSDLRMKCSCPDWAVPCKHIAAVIYLMSLEIDGNPFAVFSLRGVDLSGELKSRGIFIENEAKGELPKLSDLLSSRYPQLVFPVAPSAKPDSDRSAYDFSTLDYSELGDLSAPLAGVLSPNPSFFHQGDFRLFYERMITRLARKARQLLETGDDADGNISILGQQYKPRLVLSEGYHHEIATPAPFGQLTELLAVLRSLSEDDLADLQPEVAAFYHIQMACLHFLAHGAVIPQIFEVDSSTAQIRWLPALLDAKVSKIVSELAGLLLPELLILEDIGDSQLLSNETTAVILCSLVLDALVSQLSDSNGDKANENQVVDLFFGSKRGSFLGPGQGEITSGIQAWLSRFHFAQADYVPMLWLEEAGEGFSLSLRVEKRGESVTGPAPLSEVLSQSQWQGSRYSILQKIALLTEFFPGLGEYVSSGAQMPIWLSQSDLQAFLFDAVPIIRLLGLRAILPKELDRLLRPKLTVKIVTKSEPSGAFFNFSDLLDFNWRVAIGTSYLSKAEFEDLVKTAHGIVKFRGEYVYLDPGEIEQLRKQLEKAEIARGAELLRIALSQEYFGAPIELDVKVRKLIKQLTAVSDIDEPSGLVATLRPYQKRGYQWLYRNTRAGFGSLIADDMGLGKTLQVISTLAKLKEEGELDKAKALVVVPTSLLSNWSREIAKFAPFLTSQIFHGSKRELESDVPDIVLTSYGVARSDLARLKKLPWKVVISDEAQNIKNPGAAQTKAMKSIPAQTFIAMSGTPVENRLSEYWSIMDFANRGLLGNVTNFTKEFANPIQKHHDHDAVMRFRRVTAPFLLRRLKSDRTIISDLPEKVEQDYLCDLSKDQAALYESIVREALASIEGESDLFRRQGAVLQMILALKQICNHPAQYLKSGDVDFSRSGKSQLLLDLLEPIYESHEKVLIFTQFRAAGELLSNWILQRFARQPQFLYGGLSRKQRDDMVTKFQEDPTERAFILSLKAGGTGLNLTAATYVIHFDLWWNPAVEQQATDRAYRIGQDRSVSVYRLITRNTFEERINDMITAKRDLAELSVGAGEQWIGNLSNKELKEVFSLS